MFYTVLNKNSPYFFSSSLHSFNIWFSWVVLTTDLANLHFNKTSPRSFCTEFTQRVADFNFFNCEANCSHVQNGGYTHTMHARTHIRMHTHTHTYTHTCTRTHMHTHIHTHAHTQTYTHTQTHTYADTLTDTRTHTHTHARRHTHTRALHRMTRPWLWQAKACCFLQIAVQSLRLYHYCWYLAVGTHTHTHTHIHTHTHTHTQTHTRTLLASHDETEAVTS